MNRLKTFLFVSLFLISSIAVSQNEHWWWYEIHEHDGVTPWQRYLIMSPGFFGPNAFPVPDINTGLLNTKMKIETAVEGHFNKHERTENLFTRLFIPLVKGKVELQLSMVPVEIFSYDTIIRDQRFSRNYEGKGSASGDLYISTLIQLLKDHPKWPDLMLGINLKTASGNEFESARFADSPGYYFDLSAGKSFAFKEESFIQSLRLYAMLGFYAWQTNLPDHFQDDAVLYGIGANLDLKHFSINQNFGGFSGYLNNGDKPQVYRFEIQSKSNGAVNFKVRFQYGLNDSDFRSLRLSMLYSL